VCLTLFSGKVNHEESFAQAGERSVSTIIEEKCQSSDGFILSRNPFLSEMLEHAKFTPVPIKLTYSGGQKFESSDVVSRGAFLSNGGGVCVVVQYFENERCAA